MTKILLLVAIAYLFILFFRYQGPFIRWIAGGVTGDLALSIMRLGMGLLTGWVIYILIVMVGNLGRIATLNDIFVVLRARPSEVGGSGMVGVIIGGIFALYTMFHWNPLGSGSGPIQGRTVYFQTFTRRVGVIGSIRRVLQKLQKP